jgi:two-component system, NtrC family, nitrogen regulation sensor histidine kinase GlnL
MGGRAQRKPMGGPGDIPMLRQRVASLEQQNDELSNSLKELRAYYEDLLSSLQDGVIILDPRGFAVSMNQAAEELTGYSSSHTVGRPIGEAFPPLSSLVAKTVALGRSHAVFDATIARADGGRLFISAVASLVSDPGGETRGVVLVLRDLSRVRDLEEQVRRSDRLAALGVLAAGMAHEVRNPLVGVRAAAQLLEKEPTFSPNLQEFTRIIIREVDRLNRLMDGLLAFAARRPVQGRPCNINQVVDEALRLEESGLQTGGVRIARKYDPEVPAVLGDSDRLLQVFLNLIRNGAQAMAGGGELLVRTRFERLASQIGGRAAAVVEIVDRGPGISPEVQAQLFNPFFTTKAAGAGLGLPISQRIVEEHGGAIEVQSQAGEGSTFRVLLPIPGEEQGART